MDEIRRSNLKEKKKPQFKIIPVDKEMISLLEAQRKKISEFGWDALNITWVDLTRVLARKVRASKII